MIVKVVKAVVLTISIFTLAGCGGGSSTQSSSLDTSSQSSGTPSTSSASSTSSVDIFSGTGTASLSWIAPTTYDDGSSLTANLAGHYIYIDSGNGFVRIGSIDNPTVSNYIVENLVVGNFQFAVTAYDSMGVESAFSNNVTVVIS